METKLQLEMLPQPDDTTCGPTCLHSIYRYYGLDISLQEVIAGVPSLEGGGTLDVLLACDALRRGFDATIYTYNLILFDPSWFDLKQSELPHRLRAQAQFKRKKKLQLATEAYLEFLQLGGEVRLEDLTTRLIRKYLKRDMPIIAGLSSTYLYRAKREYGDAQTDDDIRGEPTGHFVVLSGYDMESRNILVADPMRSNPISRAHVYEMKINRVIAAIMLGIVTYDANLIIIRPRSKRG